MKAMGPHEDSAAPFSHSPIASTPKTATETASAAKTSRSAARRMMAALVFTVIYRTTTATRQLPKQEFME